MHLISVGAFPVEVEAAVEILRPSGCLIRNVHLNQSVCAEIPAGVLAVRDRA
jgi:hypothetical protein